jgi:hypothetical protein
MTTIKFRVDAGPYGVLNVRENRTSPKIVKLPPNLR